MMNFSRIAFLSALVLGAIACSSSDDNKGGGGGGQNPPPGGGGCSGDGCIAVALSLAGDVSCAIMKDGTGRCWGPAYTGGRGRGDKEKSSGPEPMAVTELTAAADIFINNNASCARLRDGTVKCWGDGNGSGNGTGEAEGGKAVPAAVNATGSVKALVGSDSRVCALLQDGGASCWQQMLAIAPAAPDPSLVPVKVPTVVGATELAVGGDHICILNASGVVSCYGFNKSGQLGYVTDSASDELKPVTDLPAAAHVWASDDSSCAALKDGKLACWGSNRGDGNAEAGPEAVIVTGVANVTSVAVGGEHTCAVVQDGSVWCWGANEHGQLGDGTTTDQAKPVKVAGITDATVVAVSKEASCIIRKDGKVLCWGSNPAGQFGARTENPTVTTPFVVPL
ncbi:RCC1 domain-containing protein [Pendulispora albinea]|uniref:BNR repeat domain protein n=1 Tax=Pendulispora albinea TaxID=2741071 RepID=A0ABZ2MBV6_9BACT